MLGEYQEIIQKVLLSHPKYVELISAFENATGMTKSLIEEINKARKIDFSNIPKPTSVFSMYELQDLGPLNIIDDGRLVPIFSYSSYDKVTTVCSPYKFYKNRVYMGWEVKFWMELPSKKDGALAIYSYFEDVTEIYLENSSAKEPCSNCGCTCKSVDTTRYSDKLYELNKNLDRASSILRL